MLSLAAAHDCGKVINPILVEGQVCGAFAMGLGGALTEEIQYDANGIQLTKSFKDYVMLRMADIPPIGVAHHDSPNPDNLFFRSIWHLGGSRWVENTLTGGSMFYDSEIIWHF